MRILIPVFTALIFAFPGQLFSQNTKADLSIMCIGDSITEGGKTFTVYRPILDEMLRDEFNVSFVGTKGSGSMKHEGYGGKNIAFLADTIPAHFAKHPASAVLIHAGHNNFAKDKPIQGIIMNTRKLIEGCRASNPKVTIFLGQVITSKKLPKYNYIPELNDELATLAAELDSEQSPVILVNHAKGFDPDTMTVVDKVHPNEKGAKHMAEQWTAAIRATFSK